MPGHPTDVGGTPVDVIGLHVEDDLVGVRRAEEVARGRVQDALWLCRRPRRVQEIQHVLGVDGDRLALIGLPVDDVVPPVVAVRNHVDAMPGRLDDDGRLDRGRARERFVGVMLESDLLAAPVPAIGGDQDLGLAVVDPTRQRLGREPAEDDRVRRPDPGAGEHRDRQLRDHRHVDGDAVARLDAELLEGVGRLADLALEVAERQRSGVAWLADPVVGRLVAEAPLDVSIDAVVADVELAAGEPLRERQIPFERRRERRRPVELFASPLRPEGLEIRLRFRVKVGGAVGLRGEGGVGREGPGFREEVLDLRRRDRGLDAHVHPR